MIAIDGVNYLTVEEVCRMLAVKPATIYAYVSRGIIRSYKQGIKRQRLYREDEIKALLEIRPPEEAELLPPTPPDPPIEQVVDTHERVLEPQVDDRELPGADAWMGER